MIDNTNKPIATIELPNGMVVCTFSKVLPITAQIRLERMKSFTDILTWLNDYADFAPDVIIGDYDPIMDIAAHLERCGLDLSGSETLGRAISSVLEAMGKLRPIFKTPSNSP